MKNKITKTIFLITISIALYHSYDFMVYQIKFDRYMQCMAMNSNSQIQGVAINYCLQKLK